MVNRILLLDADSQIPNLALMKISAYQKQWEEDIVGFNVSDPNIIYASVIFKENKHIYDGLKFFHPNATIFIGGSGYDLTKDLPNEIEYIKPDYSLYDGLICQKCGKVKNHCRCLDGKPKLGDMFYSMGFTTRGCIRNCYFCIVPKKEGKHKQNQHPKEFHNNTYNKIRLLDNNFFADKKWFFEVTDWLLDNKIKLDVTQGMDVRIIDLDIAQRLKELSWWGSGISFAFDMKEYEKQIRKGMNILLTAGLTPSSVRFYIYLHNEESIPDAKYRWEITREYGFEPFLMVNRENLNKRLVKIRRRGCKPAIYRNMKSNEVFA